VLTQALTSDSPSVEGVGALLQSFRTRAGLSQADLAEQAKSVLNRAAVVKHFGEEGWRRDWIEPSSSCTVEAVAPGSRCARGRSSRA